MRLPISDVDPARNRGRQTRILQQSAIYHIIARAGRRNASSPYLGYICRGSEAKTIVLAHKQFAAFPSPGATVFAQVRLPSRFNF
jgi:hypothetical protein